MTDSNKVRELAERIRLICYGKGAFPQELRDDVARELTTFALDQQRVERSRKIAEAIMEEWPSSNLTDEEVCTHLTGVIEAAIRALEPIPAPGEGEGN